mgnify:FL=1
MSQTSTFTSNGSPFDSTTSYNLFMNTTPPSRIIMSRFLSFSPSNPREPTHPHVEVDWVSFSMMIMDYINNDRSINRLWMDIHYNLIYPMMLSISYYPTYKHVCFLNRLWWDMHYSLLHPIMLFIWQKRFFGQRQKKFHWSTSEYAQLYIQDSNTKTIQYLIAF